MPCGTSDDEGLETVVEGDLELRVPRQVHVGLLDVAFKLVQAQTSDGKHGRRVPSPPSIASLMMLGSNARTGKTSWPRFPKAKDRLITFFAFSKNDSYVVYVVDTVMQTAETMP